ncbi:MAG TPA: hypothetical protein VK204_18605 [Nocardioidaceae bacterium]|nr:hypothetical protein [Nocardioidaceae bacterium]
MDQRESRQKRTFTVTACNHVAVEGRALQREPRKQWAWLVPWFSGEVASLVGNATGADRVSAVIIGLAAGAVWQLLFRRDLTSRLTFMAVVVTVGLIATLATRQDFVWEDMNRAGLHAIGILLGLIYTEHYQRWRDRAERKSVSPVRESDAAAR